MTIRIEKETIGEAHNATMKHLLQQWVVEAEDIIVTEDDDPTVESPGMAVRVTKPWKSPQWSDALQFRGQMLEEYIREITEISRDTGFEYTYGNRLWDYPHVEECNDLYGDIEAANWTGDGDGYGINQIRESIINRLATSPTSRRAIAVTWVVMKDLQSRDPPCLQFVQFLLRENHLNLHAVFRSHDMAGGWGPNVYALHGLQLKVINMIRDILPEPKPIILPGYIETYSVSAHIYVKQDQVQAFRRYLNI